MIVLVGVTLGVIEDVGVTDEVILGVILGVGVIEDDDGDDDD